MNKKLLLLSAIISTAIILSGCTITKSVSPNAILLSPDTNSTSPADSNETVTPTNTTIAPQTKLTQIELILDDSGSMVGLVEGKSKIDIAKESIGKIIDELKTKDNLQVALRIYGHQNKECTNSVLEFPMGKINADQMKSKVVNLKPLGSTPISYSLTESVKDFNKTIPGDKMVILVTDGLESCGGDPCAAAKALLAGGVINKMQVVGFGMSKTELGTLQCIADPFKGQVVGANNSTEFLSAMQQIVEKATTQPNFNVSVIGADGKPLQASDICVYPQGQTETETACAGMFTAEYEFKLTPGIYDLKVSTYDGTGEKWTKDVEIKASQTVSQKIAL